MSWSFVTSGQANDKATTDLVFALGAAVAVGDLIVVVASVDSTIGGSISNDPSDSLGNTYDLVPDDTGGFAMVETGNTSTTVDIAVWYTVVTTAGTPTITVTFAGGAARAAIARAFRPTAGTPTPVDVVTATATGASSIPLVTAGAACAIGDLFVAAIGWEGPIADWSSGDTDTSGGAWATAISDGTTGGSAVTNCSIASQHKLNSTTAHTGSFSNGIGTSRDYVAAIVAFRETATAERFVGRTYIVGAARAGGPGVATTSAFRTIPRRPIVPRIVNRATVVTSSPYRIPVPAAAIFRTIPRVPIVDRIVNRATIVTAAAARPPGAAAALFRTIPRPVVVVVTDRYENRALVVGAVNTRRHTGTVTSYRATPREERVVSRDLVVTAAAGAARSITAAAVFRTTPRQPIVDRVIRTLVVPAATPRSGSILDVSLTPAQREVVVVAGDRYENRALIVPVQRSVQRRGAVVATGRARLGDRVARAFTVEPAIARHVGPISAQYRTIPRVPIVDRVVRSELVAAALARLGGTAIAVTSSIPQRTVAVVTTDRATTRAVVAPAARSGPPGTVTTLYRTLPRTAVVDAVRRTTVIGTLRPAPPLPAVTAWRTIPRRAIVDAVRRVQTVDSARHGAPGATIAAWRTVPRTQPVARVNRLAIVVAAHHAASGRTIAVGLGAPRRAVVVAGARAAFRAVVITAQPGRNVLAVAVSWRTKPRQPIVNRYTRRATTVTPSRARRGSMLWRGLTPSRRGIVAAPRVVPRFTIIAACALARTAAMLLLTYTRRPLNPPGPPNGTTTVDTVHSRTRMSTQHTSTHTDGSGAHAHTASGQGRTAMITSKGQTRAGES